PPRRRCRRSCAATSARSWLLRTSEDHPLVTAVDIQVCSAHVGGPLRCQEDDRIGYVVGFTPASQRNGLAPHRLLLFEAATEVPLVVDDEVLRQRTRDPARAHRIREDAVAAEIVGQRLHEGMLGRIDDGRPQYLAPGHLAGLADDQDDAPALLAAHVRHGMAHDLPGTEYLGAEMSLDVGGRQFIEAAAKMRPGIADDDVETAEPCDGLGNEALGIVRTIDVRKRACDLSRRREACDCVLQAGLVAAAEEDPCPLFEQAPG